MRDLWKKNAIVAPSEDPRESVFRKIAEKWASTLGKSRYWPPSEDPRKGSFKNILVNHFLSRQSFKWAGTGK